MRPGFRAALATAGFTLDPATGEVAELVPYVGGFSERASQISRNIDKYEAEWRAANPSQEPGSAIRQSWDRRAWKDARPDKITPTDGAAILADWNQQLHDLGYRDPIQPGLPLVIGTPGVGALDREAVVETVLTRLGARRSAWNAADIRGEVEKQIAATGMVVDAAVRVELAEDLTARTVTACVPLLDRSDVPEHVRSLTSPRVLGVEADIVGRLASRADAPMQPTFLTQVEVEGLDEAQQAAVAVLAGESELVVMEGAAGAGKTTTLAAAKSAVETQGHRMLVVTPTLKAAQVAAREVGQAGSVAWLIHQHGFRWDDDGRWTRQPATPATEALLAPGDLILVDESGMLDHDTASALLTIADEAGARIALLGDRHQLPAVGRGGVLDLAATWVTPQAHVDLDTVHRFADPEYAAISLALRTGTTTYTVSGEACSEGNGERLGEVWEALCRRNQVRVYLSEVERTQGLAGLAAEAILTGRRETTGALVMADTREQAAAVGAAIRDRLVAAGVVDDTHTTVTGAGERVGVGDRVATRRNDRDLGVTNRATWTVTAITDDGGLALRGRRTPDVHIVPAAYAREHVELAYATTVYGAQGETTGTGHLALGEHTSASSAYVAMTRGRDHNIVHIVADDLDDAKQQWDDVFSRDRADLGPAVAAHRAVEDVDRYGTQTPVCGLDEALADLRAAWTEQADLAERLDRLTHHHEQMEAVLALRNQHGPRNEELRQAERAAARDWVAADGALKELNTTIAADQRDLITDLWRDWRSDEPLAYRAAATIRDGAGPLGLRRGQVRDARIELAEWAHRWRPVFPGLPADPSEAVAHMGRIGEDRLRNAITETATRRAEEAHPAADTVRNDAEAAGQARLNAERAVLEYGNSLSKKLLPYGHAAHLQNLPELLAEVRPDLDRLIGELGRADQRVQTLARSPEIRSLPVGRLDSERDQWQTDRQATREAARAAARRQAALKLAREAEARRRPFEPSRSPSRGRGPGIGF